MIFPSWVGGGASSKTHFTYMLRIAGVSEAWEMRDMKTRSYRAGDDDEGWADEVETEIAQDM